jgi:hypothetical protein
VPLALGIVRGSDDIPIKVGAFYGIGRGYLDFERLYRLTLSSAFFVTRTIKAFYDTTENALKTQIWIAVSVYVLVAIVRKRLGLEATLYLILPVLSITLFEKTSIKHATPKRFT